MKIIVFHIISHLDMGGAERVAINIAKSKSRDVKYHIVEVVRGNSDFTNQLIKEMTDSNICYHRSPIGFKKIGVVLFPFWFLFLYLKYRPRIIHTHTEIPDLAVFLFHFLYPWHKNYIRTIHNTELWNDWKVVGNVVERFFISRHSNVVISEAVRDSYEKNYHSSGFPLIYNGVESKKQKDFSLLVEGKINILFAGRLEVQKGINVLITVINQLKSDKRYFFHIVGNGSLKQDLNKLSGNNYRLYDKIYDLASYMGSFDYMFMPSNFEGLALTAIEACFAKVPVIINSCKGLEEIFPMDWPLKVKDNSVDDFVYIYINKLPYLDKNMIGERGYQYALAHFSIEQMQHKYELLYHERAKA